MNIAQDGGNVINNSIQGMNSHSEELNDAVSIFKIN